MTFINNDIDNDRTLPAGVLNQPEKKDLTSGGVVLGHYHLKKKLGSGAMGSVFLCNDTVSGVDYALKMVPPELARDKNIMDSILSNFQLVHKLKHENIASADFLERDEDGSFYLLMEFVSGENLSDWLKKHGPADIKTAKNILRQVAAALDYAHKNMILHRDIKPANIMITPDGSVKVVDFGLASEVRSSMTMLSINPANSRGTPNYLSPEQFKGIYPSKASDQYALAVLAYEMLAGHPPFMADDLQILKSAVIENEPEKLNNIPDHSWKAIKKALSKYPKDRFSSCTAFADALENKQALCEKQLNSPDMSETSESKVNYWKIMCICLVIAALIAGVWYWFVSSKAYEYIPPEEIPTYSNTEGH